MDEGKRCLASTERGEVPIVPLIFSYRAMQCKISSISAHTINQQPSLVNALIERNKIKMVQSNIVN